MKYEKKPHSKLAAVRFRKQLLHAHWRRFCMQFLDDDACRAELSGGAQNNVFSDIRKPRAWLGCIWLMQQGIQFNANDLHELAQISYSTSWKIYNKVCMQIFRLIANEPTAITVDSADFIAIITRRSLETDANAHPKTEEEKASRMDQTESFEHRAGNEDQQTNETNQSTTADDSQTEAAVYNVLSTEPQHFNDICDLCNIPTGKLSSLLIEMELKGLIQQAGGDFYVKKTLDKAHTITISEPNARQEHQNRDWTQARIILLIKRYANFIYSLLQGVSRKRLQTYLLAVWIFTATGRWGENALLNACKEGSNISDEELRGFVTPRQVKIVAFT